MFRHALSSPVLGVDIICERHLITYVQCAATKYTHVQAYRDLKKGWESLLWIDFCHYKAYETVSLSYTVL
jgi:hypothetical protein